MEVNGSVQRLPLLHVNSNTGRPNPADIDALDIGSNSRLVISTARLSLFSPSET
jgi:hypothetical protein